MDASKPRGGQGGTADDTPTHESPRQLVRELYFNRTGVLFLLMVLVSLGMVAASAVTVGDLRQFWLAVGTSILATTVYGFVQVLLTTRQFDRFLRVSIQGAVLRHVSDGADRLANVYREMQAQYVPNRQYPGVDEPDMRFNRDLNASLRTAQQYVFRGLSGQYAVARLKLLTSVPSDVSLILADPTKPAVVDARARRLLMADQQVEWDAVRQRLLDGIHLALAGAHAIQMRFDSLQICLTADPHIDRIELTERELYLTRFSDTADASYFPPTMRFGRDSLIYQIYSRDCARVLSSPLLTRFDVPKDASDAEYAAFLTNLGLNMSLDRLREFKARFHGFCTSNAAHLVPRP